jgi:2-succinyl-5-enolpyruvyl-6-hydroxy-3-cyclohexene-1-carboxylate synthase
MPAVIEASLTNVPLVVVSADRPLELRGSGASQTIDQHDLFGVHVRASRELPAARAAAVAVRRVRATVAEALARATGTEAGPIHLNVPFDEPLAPLPDPEFMVPVGSPQMMHPAPGLSDGSGTTAMPGGSLDEDHLDARGERDLRALLFDWTHKAGIFVVGPLDQPLPELVELARRLNWPVLADVASQLRDVPGVFTTGDLLARRTGMESLPAPRHLVQVGMVPTSSALARWMDGAASDVLLILSGPLRQDPQAHATRVIVAKLRAFFARMLVLDNEVRPHLPGPHHLAREPFASWTAALEVQEQRLEALPSFRSLEASAVHQACRILPPGSNLVLASSMPIRYAEACRAACPWARAWSSTEVRTVSTGS